MCTLGNHLRKEKKGIFKMVPEARLELARLERRGILNPLCLPIPPLGLSDLLTALDGYGGVSRSRTELHGFAIQCITALLTRR